MSLDKSGEYIKNVHIQFYINDYFGGSYLCKQHSELCSVQPTQTRDLVLLCQDVSVPHSLMSLWRLESLVRKGLIYLNCLCFIVTELIQTDQSKYSKTIPLFPNYLVTYE